MNSSKRNIGVMVFAFPQLSETFILNQLVYLKQKGYSLSIFAYQKKSLANAHKEIIEYGLLDQTIYFWKSNGKFFSDFFRFINKVWAKNQTKLGKRILKGLRLLWAKGVTNRIYFFLQWLYLPELEDIDILHAHFGDVATFPAALKSIGLLEKTPFLVSFHGYDLVPSEKKYNQKRYRNLLRYAHAVTVNSNYTQAMFKEVSESNFIGHVELLNESLDCSKFEKTRTRNTQDNIQIVFCGRLVHWKGPDLAIKIFSEVLKRYQGDKKLTLMVIGAGPLEHELFLMVKGLGIDENVRLLGRKTQQEIKEIFEKSDVFLYPGITDPKTGRAENQGLVIQEAQAMELPVICSTAGGSKEGIVDGQTGIVVDEGDIDGFVQALLNLLENDELRIQMGKNGREWVASKFDQKVLGEKLKNLYQLIS